MKLKLLLGESIVCIYTVIVIENNLEILQDNILILKTLSGKLIEITINYKLKFRVINKISDVKIIGEYTQYLLKYSLIAEFHLPLPITSIINYYNGKSYHFASEFFSKNNDFIFALCYGFDELKILNQVELQTAVNLYDSMELKKLKPTHFFQHLNFDDIFL